MRELIALVKAEPNVALSETTVRSVVSTPERADGIASFHGNGVSLTKVKQWIRVGKRSIDL